MIKKSRHIPIIFLLFFIWYPEPNAQVPELRIWLDTVYIRIGEQVKLHLEVKNPLRSNISAGEIISSLPPSVEMIGNPVYDTIQHDNVKVIRGMATITSFDSGIHVIQPLPGIFMNQGKNDTVYSNSLILQVFIPGVDASQQIKDIKPPINTPLSIGEILPYIGAGILFLLMVAIIVYLIYRLKKKRSPFVKENEPIPAHIIAFQELDRLKDEKLWQSGKVKEYYVRLSDILRIYLENRYGFRAMECITDEIMNDFRKVSPDRDIEAMLTEILHISDMVKFAKADPLPADNHTNLNNAYLFVEKTRVIEMKTIEELRKENISVDDQVQ